jgi:hypothetical protein
LLITKNLFIVFWGGKCYTKISKVNNIISFVGTQIIVSLPNPIWHIVLLFAHGFVESGLNDSTLNDNVPISIHFHKAVRENLKTEPKVLTQRFGLNLKKNCVDSHQMLTFHFSGFYQSQPAKRRVWEKS